MTCIVQFVLICLGATYMASTIPLTVLALYCIQKFYLKTSRQIRLLDLEARSPVYQHFTETLEGLDTIRAFHWQKKFEDEALQKIDHSQKPYYLMTCIQRWLSLSLEFIIAALAITLVAMALCIPRASDGGFLGVGLTTMLVLNNSLQAVISSWTQAETSLAGISRTKTFEESTPNENSNVGSEAPDADWPRGAVKVSELTVKYR
jgi:ATP-binding cassette subfamily C (CFTR/MRP) protein 1